MGFASRTDAEQMIIQGRVKVDDIVVRDPERRTYIDRDFIEVDGQFIQAHQKSYFVFHKPTDVLTTFKDPQGRTTVYDFIPKNMTWIFPIGRLDANTSGLLIFTNDTNFGEKVTNNRWGVEKTYEVKARGVLSDVMIERLKAGVRLDDGYRTLPCRCVVDKINEGTTWLTLTLQEGKNRQIRRMLEAVGSEVVKLRRVAIGRLELGDLKSGELREIPQSEIFRKVLGPSALDSDSIQKKKK